MTSFLLRGVVTMRYNTYYAVTKQLIKWSRLRIPQDCSQEVSSIYEEDH
jgi:hypothetical protein